MNKLLNKVQEKNTIDYINPNLRRRIKHEQKRSQNKEHERKFLYISNNYKN